MISYVPSFDGIYCFVEQSKSEVNRLSQLKLTKKDDVAGCHGATKNANSMKLTRGNGESN